MQLGAALGRAEEVGLELTLRVLVEGASRIVVDEVILGDGEALPEYLVVREQPLLDAVPGPVVRGTQQVKPQYVLVGGVHDTHPISGQPRAAPQQAAGRMGAGKSGGSAGRRTGATPSAAIPASQVVNTLNT